MKDALDAMMVGISNITPATPAQVRERAWRENVLPKLINAGFHERHVKPLPMKGKQRAAFDMLKGLLCNVGAIVALVGPRGVGKTTMVGALAAGKAWEDYQSIFDKADGKCQWVLNRCVVIRKMTTIVGRLKAYYGDFGTIEMERLERSRQFLTTCDLLIVDELHEVDEDSKHKSRTLTDIIDCRYAARRDSVLISNETDRQFRANISTSIMSRLEEHGKIISCDWPSHRTPKP